jgi:hypothetical protein
MRKYILSLVLIVSLCSGFSSVLAQENWDNALVFTVTADMRYYATEPYRTSQHFLGAVEAIKKIGKGSFMIVPGDVDPPQAVHEVITKVLGADYPWYPAPGNHELDVPEYAEWLRQYNKNGTTLPHIVRKGPPGSEQMMYSFDWQNCHFIALNQYYDGKTDTGADGNLVPELFAWLEDDLRATTKNHIFVFGHEPIIAMPDMNNGRIRHQGDSLDKYSQNAFRFHQLLLKYNVTAYICGHTHNTSFSNINGVWQIDAGHARGIEEDSAPNDLFAMLLKFIEEKKKTGMTEEMALQEYYKSNETQVNKTLFYAQLDSVDSYKKITAESAIRGLTRFFQDYKQGGDAREKITKTFWDNSGYTKSSFFKICAGEKNVKVEIYRDDGRGGDYSLRHTLILD